jgi:rhodanese-related sulfurtransferase
VAEGFRAKGFKNVKALEGGVDSWKKAGFGPNGGA